MPRELLDQELHTLLENLLAMGALADKAIDKASQALESQDKWLANEVVEGDSAINEARWGLENECYRLLATQQPMATDLRTVGAVLAIVSDLERIADHAKGTARIVLRMTDEPLREPADVIQQMFKICRKDLQLVLQAFVNRDEQLALFVRAADDQIDSLYRQAFNELLAVMMRDPRTVNEGTYLIWTAHKLERIHDRINNIARRTIFMVTGRMEEVEVR